MSGGEVIDLQGLHPEPPFPGDDSGERKVREDAREEVSEGIQERVEENLGQ